MENNNKETKFCKFCKGETLISEFDLNNKGNPKRYCRAHNHLRRSSSGIGKRKQDFNEYDWRNYNLHKLGFVNYQEYLKSDLWKSIRAKVFEIKGHNCHVCKKYATEIHHNGYGINVLKGETIQPLRPICRKCHKAIEFIDGKKNTVSQARDEFYKRKKPKKRKDINK